MSDDNRIKEAGRRRGIGGFRRRGRSGGRGRCGWRRWRGTHLSGLLLPGCGRSDGGLLRRPRAFDQAGVELGRNAGRQTAAEHQPRGVFQLRFYRGNNRAGGLEGGVTNGQDVVVRAFMKPISTLRRGLPSVDIETREAHRSQWERSDVTAVPACGVVCEAMLAIVLADAMREKFGGDSLTEMRRTYDAYLAQIRAF